MMATPEPEPIDPGTYTIIGHSCLLPSFSLNLRGKGLKAIASMIEDEDTVRITIHDRGPYEIAVYRRVITARRP